MKERVLYKGDAIRSEKQFLKPCRGCVLQPSDCGKLLPVHSENRPLETTLLCGMGKGWVTREENFIRIERNGQSRANKEIPTGAEVAV